MMLMIWSKNNSHSAELRTQNVTTTPEDHLLAKHTFTVRSGKGTLEHIPKEFKNISTQKLECE